MIIVYSLIILLATTSGAIAGLGGGVIIKPLLDLVGYHDATTIGFYSSLAVFTMCIVSLYKQIKSGFKFQIKTAVMISIGSLIGGLLGEKIFNITTSMFPNHIVKIVQASLLLLTLILIFIYSINKDNIKSYHVKNDLIIIFVGLGLGVISIFLGIGGGPLNVATLMLLFSQTMKEATVYSITTIFFSQISKLGTICLAGNIASFDLSFIPAILIAAVIGGYLGTRINQRINNKQIQKFYNLLILILIGVSIYNIVNNLMMV